MTAVGEARVGVQQQAAARHDYVNDQGEVLDNGEARPEGGPREHLTTEGQRGPVEPVGAQQRGRQVLARQQARGAGPWHGQALDGVGQGA